MSVRSRNPSIWEDRDFKVTLSSEVRWGGPVSKEKKEWYV